MALRETDPAQVGGYRIEDRLDPGGMGVVHLARSASGRRLALKVVQAQHAAADDEFRILPHSRLRASGNPHRREVAAARQVSGACTAPVVDADAAPRPWTATLHIPGEDLGTHIRRHGPLPLPKLREPAAGLAEALARHPSRGDGPPGPETGQCDARRARPPRHRLRRLGRSHPNWP